MGAADSTKERFTRGVWGGVAVPTPSKATLTVPARYQVTSASSSKYYQPLRDTIVNDTDISRSASAPIVKQASDEEYLATLRPVERWKYLANKRTTQFLAFVLAFVAWLLAVTSAWSDVKMITAAYVTSAYAQGATVTGAGPQHEFWKLENVLLILLSCFVVWSLGTVTFSKTADKIKLAGDTLKTLLGFIIGFFSTNKTT